MDQLKLAISGSLFIARNINSSGSYIRFLYIRDTELIGYRAS